MKDEKRNVLKFGSTGSSCWYHCLDFSLTHDDACLSSRFFGRFQLECDIRMWDASADYGEPRLSGSFDFRVASCSTARIAWCSYDKSRKKAHTHIRITCDCELYVNICKTSNMLYISQIKWDWSQFFFFSFHIGSSVFWSCRLLLLLLLLLVLFRANFQCSNLYYIAYTCKLMSFEGDRWPQLRRCKKEKERHRVEEKERKEV